MKDDAIRRQAAINAAETLLHGNNDIVEQIITENNVNVFCAKIMGLPAAQSEIIRCKDCKHRPIATRADEGILWGFSVEFPDEICPLQCEDGWYNYYPKDDFYCANAERRTDG